MKQIIKYIGALLLGGIFFASCMDDIDVPNTKVVEGIPVTTTLSFQTGDATVITRATAEEEDRVSDLYVLVFSKNGNLVSHQYFSGANINNDTKEVKLQTTSGEKRIYAVANVTGNSFTANEVHLKAKIDQFVESYPNNTLDKWLALSATINENQITWADARFLMSGWFVSNSDAGSDLNGDVIPGDGSCVIGNDGLPTVLGKIQLVRTVSSLSFNISLGKDVTKFSSVTWKVHNVPKSVYLNRQTDLGTPSNTVFFASNAYEGAVGTPFQFYMLENRQETDEDCEESDLYEEADWREMYSMDGDLKVFTNAPEHGTYVELNGYFEGKAKDPFDGDKVKDATGPVTYYIHLGYVDGPEDFSICRNYKYTYNIKIDGVDKIIVEANNGDDTPRADGDILFSGAKVIEVDAHYERIVIDLEGISSVEDILCGISTAKTGFQYKSLDKLAEAEEDTDWVYFIEKSKVPSNGPNFTAYGTSGSNLMTIRDLVNAFDQGGSYHGNTGKIELYAYVKENYYDDLPLSDFVNYEATTGEDRSRQMMISVTRKSAGNSSVSTSKYVIKQKPIVTIFNMENSAVKAGKTWGMEWINENLPEQYRKETTNYDGKAGSGLSYGLEKNQRRNSSDYYSDGLANMKVELANGKVTSWNSNAINLNKMTAASAYAACMSRNRDENGNGTIDPEEIKWYLPAINQYQHFWLGMGAVPNDAALYPKEYRDNQQWKYYHYASSGGHLFWAEEGCATSYDLNEYASLGYGKYHIRCARNLISGNAAGDDKNKPMLALTETITKGSDSKGDYRTIDIGGRLTEASFRAIVSNQMGKHNEYSEANKLYKKIYVREPNNEIQRDGQNKGWSATATAVYGTSNPCSIYGDGWRAPTQRELILMTTVGLTERKGDLFSATYFSYWNYGNNSPIVRNPESSPRIGFQYSGFMTLVTPSQSNGQWGTGGSVYIRCVKDAE